MASWTVYWHITSMVTINRYSISYINIWLTMFFFCCSCHANRWVWLFAAKLPVPSDRASWVCGQGRRALCHSLLVFNWSPWWWRCQWKTCETKNLTAAQMSLEEEILVSFFIVKCFPISGAFVVPYHEYCSVCLCVLWLPPFLPSPIAATVERVMANIYPTD